MCQRCPEPRQLVIKNYKMEGKKIKVLLVNGSPRPNHNTGKALKAAMEDAIKAGAEAELINIYSIKNLKGCYSCFRSQRKGFDKTYPVCCIKDDLWPYLDKAREANVVIMGSPVYFSYPTGEFRSFYERFLFPKYSYVVDAPLRDPKNVACIFTMNCPKHSFEHANYPILLGENGCDARMVYGFGENLYIYKCRILIISNSKKKEIGSSFYNSVGTWFEFSLKVERF